MTTFLNDDLAPPDGEEQAEAMAHDALVYELSVVLMRLDGNDGNPHQLVWCGGPIPEPWGDVWQKYEEQAEAVINAIGDGSAQAMVTAFGEREWVAQVVSSGPHNFPLLQWHSADVSLGTAIGTKLYLHPREALRTSGVQGLPKLAGFDLGGPSADGVTAAPAPKPGVLELVEKLDGYLTSPEQIALRDALLAALIPEGVAAVEAPSSDAGNAEYDSWVPAGVMGTPMVPCPVCGGEAVHAQDVLAHTTIAPAAGVPASHAPGDVPPGKWKVDMPDGLYTEMPGDPPGPCDLRKVIGGYVYFVTPRSGKLVALNPPRNAGVKGPDDAQR